MKILYVITGLGIGGAERVIADLSDQMVLRGHQVKIAYLTGPVKVRPRSPDIEIIYLGLDGVTSIFSASKNYQKLLKEYKPDVVHSNMVHANIFTRINRIFAYLPRLINSAHSDNEGGILRMLAYRLTHFLADVTTNVSRNAVKEFERRKATPVGGIKAVYNGIDLCKFKYILDTEPLFNKNYINFLSIGRFHDAKDYPNLIQAVYLVKQCTNKSVRFYIVGDGNLRLDLERMIEELDLIDDIILLGERADIPDLLNQAHFFVLSSKYEGFGLVVAEAMACECFVIATDSAGPAEIMGNTGILVEPQNSEKLAQSILQVLELSQEQILENNKRARKRIEDMFSLEKSVQIWLDIYENK